MSEQRAAYRARVPREASIVRAVLAHLNSLPGCLAVKRHGTGYGMAGEPDITGCLRGRRLEIEVKRPGAQATPLQQERLRRWAAAGALVGVVHSVEELGAVLAQ